LRALAVMVVVLYHAGIPFFSGGFIGVDIFFVISGYLITSIILNKLDDKNFSITSFYSRRIKRILPALLSVCLFSAIASIFLMNPAQLNEFGSNLIGAATFLSNFFLLFTSDYFDQAVEINPLIHMWTLSVEEQYYIIIPLLLSALYYFNARNIIAYFIGAFTLISLLISILLTDVTHNTFLHSISFYTIFSRAYELLAGSFIAILILNNPNYFKKPINDAYNLIGFLLICIPVVIYDSSTPFPGIHSLPIILGTAILIISLNKESIFFRILTSRLVVGVGLISYSLYLWHQPLLSFSRLYFPAYATSYYLSFVVILVSIFVSYLSWRFIENPARMSILGNKYTIIAGVFSLSVLLILGLLIKNLSSDYERQMAIQLSKNKFIYFQNMDERRFSFERIKLHQNIDTVIVGSSRLMQLDLTSPKINSLNLSISGAYMHDIYSISAAAIKTLQPDKLIIGIDPWIINKHADEPTFAFGDFSQINYWKNLAQQELVTGRFQNNNIKEESKPFSNYLFSIYKKININNASFVSNDGAHEDRPKKAFSGLHIYPIAEERKRNIKDKKVSIDSILSYGYMNKYEFSSEHLDQLRELVDYAKKYDVEINFFFTPYLPSVYSQFNKSSPFIIVESELRELANELDVQVYGSYNPGEYNCSSLDFYDGMHPAKECLDRVMGN
jgi:peptidoglycan/LPS O-acetylase OafA/YrhL